MNTAWTRVRRSTGGIKFAALIAACVLASGILASCCTGHSTSAKPMVVVPEQDFRSETSAGDRISLPLTPKDRARLVLFIAKGGNMQASGVAMPLSEVETTYGKLLDWLGQEHPFSAIDGPELNRFLPGAVISDITDAREKAKPAVKGDVLAKSDGRFYWIFYPAMRPDGYGPTAKLLVTQVAATVPQ